MYPHHLMILLARLLKHFLRHPLRKLRYMATPLALAKVGMVQFATLGTIDLGASLHRKSYFC